MDTYLHRIHHKEGKDNYQYYLKKTLRDNKTKQKKKLEDNFKNCFVTKRNGYLISSCLQPRVG